MSGEGPVGLYRGDPAPWFTVRCTSNEQYHFESIGGRCVVLCFFGSAAQPLSAAVLAAFLERREIFDDERACFFGVSVDPEDERQQRVRQRLPGFRWFWDFDLAVSRAYGALREEGAAPPAYLPQTVALDERLRVLGAVPFRGEAAAHVEEVLRMIVAPAEQHAPVLLVPRVFEPGLCRALIEHYAQHGGSDSGVMRERGGMTVGVHDHGFKRRRDQTILDEELRGACVARIHRRLVPEIARAFAFEATRVERHIVACYDAADGGFFSPHRDNTSPGTAHRRFAVTLNLNAGEYGGGDLRFPEFGRRTYRAEAGGAVVFSCALLHEATPITSGRRFAYLPFLYDDAAAKVREANQRFLAGEQA